MNTSDIINGPFCPYLGWSLRWTSNNTMLLHMYSSIKVGGVGKPETLSIVGNTLIEKNIKSGQCIQVNPVDVMDFLIENWKKISSPYIKNYYYDGVIDFNNIGLDFKLICHDNTITVETPVGKTENPESETLMVVESLLFLGQTIAENLEICGDVVHLTRWQDVRRYDIVPPVCADSYDSKVDMKWLNQSLEWFSKFYNIKVPLLKKILLYPDIIQEAFVFLKDQKDEAKRFEGFTLYKQNKLPTSSKMSDLARRIMDAKITIGVPMEEDWMNLRLSAGLIELRNYIFYSRFPAINYELPG